MANVYDSANQLEKDIRSSQQFSELRESFDRLKENEESWKLFKGFQEFQQSLQQKMQSGEEISEEDAAKAQAMAGEVQQNELIGQLMQKEQAFSTIVDDLNRIIMAPIRDLYTQD